MEPALPFVRCVGATKNRERLHHACAAGGRRLWPERGFYARRPVLSMQWKHANHRQLTVRFPRR